MMNAESAGMLYACKCHRQMPPARVRTPYSPFREIERERERERENEREKERGRKRKRKREGERERERENEGGREIERE
jgi:hypothetical protein